MRIYKIVLIFVLCLLISMMFIGILDVYHEMKTDPIYTVLIAFIIMIIIFSMLSIGYHIKSFRYYRKSKPFKKENKLIAFLRIASVVCYILYLFFAIVAFLGIVADGKQDAVNITLVLIIAAFGFFGILEIVLTRKQIKKLKKEHETKDDIETIGTPTF